MVHRSPQVGGERYPFLASARRNDAETDWVVLARASMWTMRQTELFTRIVAILEEVGFNALLCLSPSLYPSLCIFCLFLFL